MTIDSAALMYRNPVLNPLGTGQASLSVVFGSGSGQGWGLGGFGNAYTLSAAKFQDDDYVANGPIAPYYVTYFAPSHEQEQGLTYKLPNGQPMPLGAGRKLLAYLSAYAGVPAGLGGVSLLQISFLVNELANAWPLSVSRPLVVSPKFDIECGAGAAIGNRIAIKIASVPANPGTGVGQSNDTAFYLQHLTIWLKGARLGIRGAA
jgi:hypothetical protein